MGDEAMTKTATMTRLAVPTLYCRTAGFRRGVHAEGSCTCGLGVRPLVDAGL